MGREGINVRKAAREETRGEIWSRLTRSMVTHALDFEATKHDENSPKHLRAKEGLATGRDEFRATFFKGDEWDDLRERTFADVVGAKVEAAQARARERVEDAEYVQQVGRIIVERRRALAGDWPLIRDAFPNQYPEPDYERQAELGDVPPRSRR